MSGSRAPGSNRSKIRKNRSGYTRKMFRWVVFSSDFFFIRKNLAIMKDSWLLAIREAGEPVSGEQPQQMLALGGPGPANLPVERPAIVI